MQLLHVLPSVMLLASGVAASPHMLPVGTSHDPIIMGFDHVSANTDLESLGTSKEGLTFWRLITVGAGSIWQGVQDVKTPSMPNAGMFLNHHTDDWNGTKPFGGFAIDKSVLHSFDLKSFNFGCFALDNKLVPEAQVQHCKVEVVGMNAADNIKPVKKQCRWSHKSANKNGLGLAECNLGRHFDGLAYVTFEDVTKYKDDDEGISGFVDADKKSDKKKSQGLRVVVVDDVHLQAYNWFPEKVNNTAGDWTTE